MCGWTWLGKSARSRALRASGEGAEPRRVALGVVDRHQLLGDEGPQDVQRRARHQVERLRDRLHAHRRLGAAEQAQDGDGAGDGGNGSGVMIVYVQLSIFLYNGDGLAERRRR